MKPQQAICPNCGASSTNLQNCEFCGSSLIRLQQQGINIEQAGYKDDSKIFKGLVSALKRNLDLQDMAIRKNENESVTTNIRVKRNGKLEPVCTITRVLAAVDDEIFFPNADASKQHLMVVFGYCPDDIEGDALKLRKFRNLDILELFTEKIVYDNDEDKWFEHAIDFGSDAEGAAQLISKVLHEVENIPYEEHLEYDTNYGDDIDKARDAISGQKAKAGKNWLITLLLCIFLGWIGVHRFYTKNYVIGVVQLFTLGCYGIWTLIDFILILVGSYKDGDGQYLVKK
ncbi:MAG: TM2 domain-containing protein [Tannerella sp.]|jgi:TM2 domain-containing membrane protein YozV|nr:TM2 domain-containing protein [Tannerella sp.]